MSAGAIWWGQIGNSLRLLDEISEHLQEERSVLLRMPERLPWRTDFYEAVDIRRAAYSGGRSLKRLAWSGGAEPGEYILKKLCSDVQAVFWPGFSSADYLGSRSDLPVNDYYVWVTGVSAEKDLRSWAEFLTRYNRASAALSKRAVFLVEYAGPALDTGKVEQIVCNVEDYDCRVFCLEAGAALKNAALREYQAELALRIGSGDPEFSWALLQTGEELVIDPVKTAMQTIRQNRDFPALSEQQILSAAWNASVVLFFPILERWRAAFVADHAQQLRGYLPIPNSNGEPVTDPSDLEIGGLFFLNNKHVGAFTPGEKTQILLCRETRNLLAHNKLLSREDARRIMEL